MNVARIAFGAGSGELLVLEDIYRCSQLCNIHSAFWYHWIAASSVPHDMLGSSSAVLLSLQWLSTSNPMPKCMLP